MPNTIYELYNAPAVGAYWNEMQSDAAPLLGESLFPAKRVLGLDLSWIKGANGLPAALAPSAFDAKPTIRTRESIDVEKAKMPFFRESMRIGEEERQQLLQLIAAGGTYANVIVTKLFDDATTLINSALVVPEAMRFSLLQTGAITISSALSGGQNVNYSYNYDANGTWADSNLKNAQTNWADENADPVEDIIAIKQAASENGVELTRAIVAPAVWAKLRKSAAIRQAVSTVGTSVAISDNTLREFLIAETGITFTVYSKRYKTFDGTDAPYMMSDRVVFLPEQPVGSTCFGTTPEEADLMSGNTDCDVEIVGNGIAVLTKKESLPVNVITAVSEIVLPSFEAMNSVYVLIANPAL
ncbi:MAG: major capsid protein [Oscillospiraceae bacterium]|jgi:hypothetical protein|nr:major capsid protein [Oscillospiraceae bacterium]